MLNSLASYVRSATKDTSTELQNVNWMEELFEVQDKAYNLQFTPNHRGIKWFLFESCLIITESVQWNFTEERTNVTIKIYEANITASVY